MAQFKGFNLIKENSLDTSNPAKRVPVCLCLDTSGSMGTVISGETVPTGETKFSDGKQVNIVTGGYSRMDQLKDALTYFYDAINSDEIARKTVDVCIVTFNDNVNCLRDYSSTDTDCSLPKLNWVGNTAMGEGVLMALDKLEQRKETYKANGIDYFQPWLVLLTDGEPQGSSPAAMAEASRKTVDLINNKKLTVFPIGIGPHCNLNELNRFTIPTQPAFAFADNSEKMKEFFKWLGASATAVSNSTVGDKPPIDFHIIEGWPSI